MPEEIFEATNFVRALLSIEREAKALKLPQSPLSFVKTPIPTDPNELYEAALPRLVALIDRSEFRDLRFADRAGSLLAQLHHTQHVAPERFGDQPVTGRQSIPFMPEWRFDRPATFRVSQIEFQPCSASPVDAPPEEASAAETQAPSVDLPAANVEPSPVEPVLPESEAPTTIKNTRSFAEMSDEYIAMFASAKLRSEHKLSVDWHLAMMRQSQARYVAAGDRAGVPWYFIAAIHGLEASFNFRAHFHNGDFPLKYRTRHVPEGRPRVWLPPSDWESSTVDALRLMGFAGTGDWSLPHLLYRLEAFNGFGYRRMGRATPYLWSFSTHYERGKFVADGRFNPRARSQQCGAAVMLKLLADEGEINLA